MQYHDLAEKLANRFQLWKLSKNGHEEYLALAHFPFGKDESVVERKKLSETSLNYCHFVQHVLNKYANNALYFCADFNFNPYLIKTFSDRDLDKINHHNSVILSNNKNIHYIRDNIKSVTVDGVLLSQRAKQKFYTLNKLQGLFFRLSLEHGLSNQNANDKKTLHKEDENHVPAYGN